ncbi:hypothetical protein HPB48_024597 [Haemaphysalis longicornis]|uniref:Uncharacterized protein n=1 Tax=Haemaphysalis longicornis TaxID=44386 RepID=A0A9J6H8H0_HAELO|nr:hypothetical protein HPB48_024597 [Haemaphysalis longicornis]
MLGKVGKGEPREKPSSPPGEAAPPRGASRARQRSALSRPMGAPQSDDTAAVHSGRPNLECSVRRVRTCARGKFEDRAHRRVRARRGQCVEWSLASAPRVTTASPLRKSFDFEHCVQLSPCYASSGMDSPHLYESASSEDLKHPSRQPPPLVLSAAPGARPQLGAFDLGSDGCVPDLAELNTPELSFDLQGFIADSSSSAHSSSSLEETLFTDLLTEQQKRYGGQAFSMPHQGGPLNEHRYGAEAGLGIKQEPLDQAEYSSCREQPYGRGLLAFPGLHGGAPAAAPTLRPVAVFLPQGAQLHGGLGVSPDAPQRRRAPAAAGRAGQAPAAPQLGRQEAARQGIRRVPAEARAEQHRGAQVSREGQAALARHERKVSELNRENDSLRKKVELLTKELAVLKSLLTNVGVPPENVDSEIARSLQGY